MENPIIVKESSAGSSLVTGLILVAGAYFAYNKISNSIADGNRSKENSKVGTDENANIASQIHSENRANITNSDTQIGLFSRITDYQAVKDAYKLLSTGKSDILEDTRPHVSKSAYQQILNIIGVKGGAIAPKSKTSDDVQNKASGSKVQYLIAKVDTRVRKFPSAKSAITFSSNIITTASSGVMIGFTDFATLAKNNNQPTYDSAHNAYFIPVKVFDTDNMKVQYTAWVAASSVDTYDTIPKGTSILRISSSVYDNAEAVAGLGNSNKELTSLML